MKAKDLDKKFDSGEDITEFLDISDVRFILVGGLAAVIQEAPVTTPDVDIVHNRSSENS